MFLLTSPSPPFPEVFHPSFWAMPGHVAATPSHLPQGCAPIPLLRNQDPSAPWIASIAVPERRRADLEDLFRGCFWVGNRRH